MPFAALCRAALLFALGGGLAGCGAPVSGNEPLSELSGRSVLLPTRFGVLSSESETSALPSAVLLGARTSGRMLLYFEFEPPEEARPLVQAQLLLSRVRSSAATDIELSRADAAGPKLRRWSDQPRALYPRLSAQLAGPAGAARLDVTDIVRIRRKQGEPLRILVHAEPGSGEGVAIATGAAGGEAPRLELYWR